MHKHYILEQTQDKTNSRIISKNILLFKISQIVETILNKIPNSTLSLLIMKTINKYGKLNTNYFNYFDNDILVNLKKEYLDSKMNDIVNNSSKINQLLDDFIIRIMGLCDSVSDSVGDKQDNFICIWNICKSHMINIMQNEIQLFKIGLDILIIYLVKEQPDLKSKASCISNSIINFLEMEINLLDTKLSIYI